MPLFSIVIPSFNRLVLLAETLNSVFAQRFTDFEIIVVDDGSTDCTLHYLKSLKQRVEVFRQSNHGPGAARNRGARHARGEYLTFLDSDDLWFPWTLDVYREVIIKYNAPSFVTGCPFVFSDEKELRNALSGAVQCEDFLDFLASGGLRWWGASSFIIRRDAFAVAGGFTEEWGSGEDVDLTLRLGVAPGFVNIGAPVTFAYRNHSGSLKHQSTRMYASAQQMILAENKGKYPGSGARKMERRLVLSRHTRAVTLICLKAGLFGEAWKMYLSTLSWNAALGRAKYLLGFPLAAVAAKIRCYFVI